MARRSFKAPEAVRATIAQAVIAQAIMLREADAAQQRVVAEAEEQEIDTGCPEHPSPKAEIAAIERLGFLHFLPYWRFINRETGKVMNFTELWDGQARMAQAMHDKRQVLVLKAGKLGASELACAYDGYRLRFGEPNMRVHLFSMDGRAAKNLLRVVRFGMEHLPDWMALPVMARESGGNTSVQMMFRAGRVDVRTVVSYAPVENAAIDQSAGHCLHGDSIVYLADPSGYRGRTAMRIRNVVAMKHPGPVLAVDPATGQMVPRAIVGWSTNALDSRLMVEVTTRHAASHKHGQRSVHLTTDHRVLTADGWVEAGALVDGALIATGEPAPNRAQAALVTGAMLGDASVNKHRRFSMTHADIDYSWWLAKGMGSLLTERIGAATPARRAQSILSSQNSIWASQLREHWYPEGVKVVDREAVEKMGDLGLAVWYLDDGTAYRRDGWRWSAGFATDGFSREDIDWLCSYLGRQGIEARPHRASGAGRWTIYVTADGSEELMRRIGRFIPDSMARKRLPLPVTRFDPSSWDLGLPTTGFDEAIVKPWEPPAHERSVFCISVEDAHNFATPGGVVSNSHVDELARMKWPESTWAAVNSTVAPGGTVHIVSRGAGAENYLAQLWEQAKQPQSTITPIFEPWDSRPRHPESEVMKERVARGEIDAGAAWYAEQEAGMPTTSQLYYYAPRTAEEALAGAGEDAFIDMARWDACFEPNMPRLQPGDEDQVVLSLDAGVTNDIFAATLTTRHPGLIDPETGRYIPGSARPDMAAIRGWKAWIPAQAVGGEVDYDEVERWVRTVCQGGCVMGHPNKVGELSSGVLCAMHNVPAPHPRAENPGEGMRIAKEFCEEPTVPCPACAEGNRIPKLNVVQIVYDRYELHDMMQSLARDRIAWVKSMEQGGDRTQADTDFRTHLIQRTTVHTADPSDQGNLLRRHIQGAKAQIPTGDDNRCRIEKRGPQSKVDLAVSASMGVRRCLSLVLSVPQRS